MKQRTYTLKQINSMSTDDLLRYASDEYGDVAVIKYYGAPFRCQIMQGASYWVAEGKTMRESIHRAMYAVRFTKPCVKGEDCDG